jgi:hypothetical protein
VVPSRPGDVQLEEFPAAISVRCGTLFKSNLAKFRSVCLLDTFPLTLTRVGPSAFRRARPLRSSRAGVIAGHHTIVIHVSSQQGKRTRE